MTRHLAIGDIHGCFTALRTLLDFVGVDAGDTLVTLGDYVNRGPNTRGVLDLLIEMDERGMLIPLRGNHDIMMGAARQGGDAYRRWMKCGGDATLRSYAKRKFDRRGDSAFDASRDLAVVPDEHWRFIDERLRASFETESHFFVHANAYSDLPLDEQPDYMLFWEKLNDPPLHESGKVMICGHTSQKSGIPYSNGNAICIDTWAFGQGWLTCLHVESGRVWQANEAGRTREMWLDAAEG